MKFEVRISNLASAGAKMHRVEFAREGSRLRVALEGRTVEADVLEVTPGIYSVLLDGRSLEVCVEPARGTVQVHAGGQVFSAQVLDPRAWRGRSGGVLEAEGRQQITAPMPGKIVRVLVAVGDAVEAGQGLLVVEAMKMQNEIRSPKTGKMERLLVKEGQAVNAGEVLAVVA
jgi:biotin carboxyl carrier protein